MSRQTRPVHISVRLDFDLMGGLGEAIYLALMISEERLFVYGWDGSTCSKRTAVLSYESSQSNTV